MLSPIRPISISKRSSILAAVLLAIPGLVRAFDDQKPEKLPPGVSEVTKDDLRSRMPSFFYFDYPFEPTPGKRIWLRIDDKHWIERYPDGMETRFRILGKAKADNTMGTIVVRLTSDPNDPVREKDDNFQVFIPDKGNEPMLLRFRTVEDEPNEWVSLGQMQKLE